MVTPNNVLVNLKGLLDLLLQSNAALSITPVVSQRGSGGFRRITWSTNTAVPPESFRLKSSTVKEYLGWVREQGYSALLYDGSLIQVSYDFINADLIGHRLLYFPCPFDIDDELLNAFTVEEVIDFYVDQGIETVRLRAPIRFDFSPNTAVPNHPKSHMTFLWDHSRVPVNSPVSLGQFIQFVFQNFYPALWNVHDFLQNNPKPSLESTLTQKEREVLHLNSSRPMLTPIEGTVTHHHPDMNSPS